MKKDLGKRRQKSLVVAKKESVAGRVSRHEKSLFSDLKAMIESTRCRVATTVNAETILMNWSIGMRIRTEILKSRRAAYGEEIVLKTAAFLTNEFGDGWNEKTIRHCLRSAETFTKKEIIYAVRRQLNWTHLKTVMYISDKLKRQFYFEMCAHEHWSTRELSEKINGMLFERTAISKKPEKLIRHELEKAHEEGELSPDFVFRSSYFLTLTGLKDEYTEKDLEDAVLNEIEANLQELGHDFAFMGRQRRITIDATDYRMDLLFYHRSLRRIIVVDLKLGEFKPEYEGQMKLYLRYLDKNERKPWEEKPLGLILCSEGNTEHIEYLMFDEAEQGIRVAQYFAGLPSKALLKRKLQRAIAIAQERLAERKTVKN